MRSVFFSIPVLGACIIAIFVGSCEKEDPPVPDYVGVWSSSWSYLDDELGDTIDINDIITLAADSYEEILQLRNRTYMTNLKNLAGMKGGLSVNGSTMSISLNQTGISSADNDGMPTGSLTWYSKGSQEYYQLVAYLELSENFSMDYSIASDVMTVLIDSNNDGDFLDPGEASFYYRE